MKHSRGLLQYIACQVETFCNFSEELKKIQIKIQEEADSSNKQSEVLPLLMLYLRRPTVAQINLMRLTL
jgi:hypothetical protein